MVRWRHAGAVVALGALFCVVALVGCGGSDSTSGASETTRVSSASETTQTTAAAPSEQFTRENWAELVSDPDAHKGAGVDIVGQLLFAPEKDDKGTYWQMYADPKNSEWNTLVAYADTAFTVAEGDYVRVIGTVEGAFEGENAFGAELILPAIRAESAEVVDATALASPAVRTATLNQSIDQYGIVVTVETVEFAADETRVFVTVENGSSNTASFYDFNAKATQGQTQYDAVSQYDYPSVQSELLPGMVSSGVAIFPAMDPAQAVKLYLEAYSDNYEVTFEPYVFDIPAE